MVLNNLFRNSIKIACSVALVSCVFSCKKEKKQEPEPVENATPGIKTIHGVAQKGPYKAGAPIIVFELNSSMGQTGKSFASTINDDAGNFSLNNISLTSNYIMITASGYYYNEHFNRTSEGQLYLEAFADVSNISTVNVNILTHILKPRIEQLVSAGSGFAVARAQAQNEFLTIVGSNGSVSTNFEALDMTNDGFLFAMSLLFQRNNSFGYNTGYNYTAELSTLLSNFRNDFANNGVIDNQSLLDTLVYNASRIDLIDTKADTQNYFTGQGLSFGGNNFETYVYNFQKKYTASAGTNIAYPATAPIMIDAPSSAPPYSTRENLLEINKKYYADATNQYAVSANVPYDSTLVVKFTAYNNPYPFNIWGGGNFGWKSSPNGSTVIYEAQRKNIVLSDFVYGNSDSVKVEYFKNSASPVPYYTKTIVFQ